MYRFQERPTCLKVTISRYFLLLYDMYLRIQEALSPLLRSSSTTSPTATPVRSTASSAIDFMTPDGTLIPRATGEAAIEAHMAVLIGGLLVGIWT